MVPVTSVINHNHYNYQNQYHVHANGSLPSFTNMSSLSKTVVFANGFYGHRHIPYHLHRQQQQLHQLSNQHYRMFNNEIPLYSNNYYIYVPLIGLTSISTAQETIRTTPVPLSMAGFIRGQYRYNMHHSYR